MADFVERLPQRLRLCIKARHYARLLGRNLLDRDFDLRGVRMLVRAGETVIDIGANVGISTHHLAQLVGRSGRVWSFEPIPETFAVLRLNLERFRLSNVTAIDRAVRRRRGSINVGSDRFTRSSQLPLGANWRGSEFSVL